VFKTNRKQKPFQILPKTVFLSVCPYGELLPLQVLKSELPRLCDQVTIETIFDNKFEANDGQVMLALTFRTQSHYNDSILIFRDYKGRRSPEKELLITLKVLYKFKGPKYIINVAKAFINWKKYS